MVALDCVSVKVPWFNGVTLDKRPWMKLEHRHLLPAASTCACLNASAADPKVPWLHDPL
ncbi:uncharacterized protein TRIREDRAFT_109486 [Trichoderma reesei QM6a]|uniref:Predicted protein n=2 Tax=Hypocrea jecorina TaxID=51453 RepID=G0RQ03_HYPJQ|nr:uncharacterized protein TRIREDRAFT_109486 [Trichoderma reesei QM6a]EGR46730.1 predicted protein [Trichoderma reesei QM6a]ETS00366.1 hypothetical protein M419DRAFT_83388 [Trichoderma reesei RUT C-30]